jgi:hypothetical protein
MKGGSYSGPCRRDIRWTTGARIRSSKRDAIQREIEPGSGGIAIARSETMNEDRNKLRTLVSTL